MDEKELPRLIRLEEARSTNSSLREWLTREPLPEGSVLWADNQTKGRGQLGNSWESEAGKNLTFSLVIYPESIGAGRQFLLSQIAALGVKDTLDKYVDSIRVKWPNDVYWKDRKICGILIENDLAGHRIATSILGIGVNVNQKQFLSDAPNPVSLAQVTGRQYDREQLLSELRVHLYIRYLQVLREELETLRNDYLAALYRADGFYPYQDASGVFDARIGGIEETGHLLLERRDGSHRRYAFKEVSFLIPSQGKEEALRL